MLGSSWVWVWVSKTVTTLTVLSERLWDEFTVRKCLVIAPKNVAQSVWTQECQKWDHLRDIRVSVIMGLVKQRLAALETDADLYVINRENVVWLCDTLFPKRPGTLPFDMVVLDELSSFKSQDAKRWKALKRTIQGVKYVVGLTGTPAPNGYQDLWSEMYLLDGGERLYTAEGRFRSRYFHVSHTYKLKDNKEHSEYALNVGAMEAINRKLSDLCLSMQTEDWLDLPPVIYNEVSVTIGAKGRSVYRKFEKEKVLPLLNGKIVKADDKWEALIEGANAATAAGKLLQMAGGAVYDDQNGVFEIHEDKLEALGEILDVCQDNVLCFYNYQHEKDRILAKFPKARVFSCPQDVDDWNAGKVPLLLCHPASTGHGLNLQFGGHTTVWFGLTWSLELYQQANARLARPGQKESVVIHHLVAKDTIDERVMEVIRGKDSTQQGLLDALKTYLKETQYNERG